MSGLAASSSSQVVPTVFRPPSPPPRPPIHLRSSQDLLAVFNLHPVYNKYVKPHYKPPNDSMDVDTRSGPIPTPTMKSSATPTPGSTSTPLDKGKGRLVESSPRIAAISSAPTTWIPATVKVEGDQEDEGTDKKKKKKEQSYRHLIKHLPGKHSMQKGDHFLKLIHAPPKQHMSITPFDPKVLREAFTVKEGGIPGYNKIALIGLDEKEKEAKKRKKEEKRAMRERARLQAAGLDSTFVPPGATIAVSGGSFGPTVRPGTGKPTVRGGSSAPTPRPIQAPTPGSRRSSVQAQASTSRYSPAPGSTPGPSASTPKPRMPSVKVETPGPSLPPPPVRAHSAQAHSSNGVQPKPAGGQRGGSALPGQQRPSGPPQGRPNQPPQHQRQPSQQQTANAAQSQAQQSRSAAPPKTGSNGHAAQNGVVRPNGAAPPTGKSQVKAVSSAPRTQQTVQAGGQGVQRGIIRKEREDESPGAVAAAQGRPATGGPRPMKKPRLDGPPKAPQRLPQPTAPQRS